jgi:hypothetical protein
MNVQRMIVDAACGVTVHTRLRAIGTHATQIRSCKTVSVTMKSNKTIKVHPAIGIAPLGNSVSGFFIGRELPGGSKRPTGYKDLQRHRPISHLGGIIS